MIRRSDSSELYDVYTRDNKTLLARDIPLEEAIKIICKLKDPAPDWIRDIERKRDEKVRKNKPKKVR